MIDNVLLSANDDPAYYESLRYAVAGWRRFFPEAKVVFGLLSEDPDLRDRLAQESGAVVMGFPLVEGIHPINQARILRHYLAATMQGDLNMVHDVDSVILQREFVVEKLVRYQKGRLFALGTDIERGGKFPMGYASASCEVWASLVNPEGRDWSGFVKAQFDLHILDHKEAINQGPISRRHPNRGFCDESWLRARLHRWNGFVTNVPFGKENWARIVTVGKDNLRRDSIELHHAIPPWKHIKFIRRVFNIAGIPWP